VVLLRAAPLLLVGLAFSACTVGAIDFTGKPCPCADGWICNSNTQTCERTDAGLLPPSKLPPEDGGIVLSDDGGGPQPRIVPSALTATWTTGTTVGWTWNTTGDPADFDHWEIITGPTQNDVSTHSLNSRTVTAKELPDLTSFERVDRRTDDRIPRFFAVTIDHPRGAEVFASVIGVDRFGNRAPTPIASGKTVATTKELVIFSEQPMPGTSSPDTFVRDTDRPRSGRFVYGSKVVCDAGQATCSVVLKQILREAGVGQVTLKGLGFDAAAFDRAYLQIAIAGNANVLPLYSSGVSLFTCNGPLADACRYRLPGFFFLGDTVYRVVEAPLRELRDPDRNALRFDILAATGFEISGINLLGTWRANAKVRVDDISIRF
jgi:hypothetical protein